MDPAIADYIITHFFALSITLLTIFTIICSVSNLPATPYIWLPKIKPLVRFATAYFLVTSSSLLLLLTFREWMSVNTESLLSYFSLIFSTSATYLIIYLAIISFAAYHKDGFRHLNISKGIIALHFFITWIFSLSAGIGIGGFVESLFIQLVALDIWKEGTLPLLAISIIQTEFIFKLVKNLKKAQQS